MLRQMETLRHLWNCSLFDRQTAWEEREENLRWYMQSKHLTEARKHCPRLAEVPRRCAEMMLRDLERAFGSFFRRCRNGEKPGYPRYKNYNRDNDLPGLRFHGTDRKKHITADFRLDAGGRIGQVRIRPKEALPEGVTVKEVMITRTADKWFVAVTSEDGAIAPDKVEPIRCVGIDVGCTHFAATSDGEYIEPPRYYRQAEKRLAMLQRRLARKKRGSVNRRKAALKVARAMHTVANARENFIHQLTHRLVGEHDLIAVEDRIAAALMRKPAGNKKQSAAIHKSIADAGWGQFAWALEYKCEEQGKTFVAVPARGTTQCCSRCASVVEKGIYDRQHTCPECGLDIGRDLNAAINILKRGLDMIGQGLPESDACGETLVADRLVEAGTLCREGSDVSLRAKRPVGLLHYFRL